MTATQLSALLAGFLIVAVVALVLASVEWRAAR